MRKFFDGKPRLSALIMMLAYKGILDIIYALYITKEYAYAGFVLDFSIGRYILSWALVLVSVCMLSELIFSNRFSGIALFFLFHLSVVPNLVIYGLSGTEFLPEFLIFWFSFYFFLLILPDMHTYSADNLLAYIKPDTRLRAVGEKLSEKKEYALIVLMFVFVLVNVFVWVVYAGMNIQTDIIDVYGLREEARGYAEPTVVKYMVAISRDILPIMFCYFYKKRKYIMAAICCVGITLLFFCEGSKSSLFFIAVAIMICFLYPRIKHKNRLFLYVSLIVSAMCLFGLAEFFVFRRSYILSLFIRRMMFLPAQINSYYYDFFSSATHPFLLFRGNGLLRILGVASPYDMDIAFLLGGIYKGDYGCSLNNGLFSYAYANLGIVGCVCHPLALSVLLKIFDSFSEHSCIEVRVSAAFIFSFVLMSSFFPTALVTHGLLVVLVFLFFVNDAPKNSEEIGKHLVG